MTTTIPSAGMTLSSGFYQYEELTSDCKYLYRVTDAPFDFIYDPDPDITREIGVADVIVFLPSKHKAPRTKVLGAYFLLIISSLLLKPNFPKNYHIRRKSPRKTSEK